MDTEQTVDIIRLVQLQERQRVIGEVMALYEDSAPRGQYERFDENRFWRGLKEMQDASLADKRK